MEDVMGGVITGILKELTAIETGMLGGGGEGALRLPGTCMKLERFEGAGVVAVVAERTGGGGAGLFLFRP